MDSTMNLDHVSRLADITSFNLWRTEHPDLAIDLSDADLAGMDLSKAVLAGAAMQRANLRDAILHETICSGADMTQADMTRARLTRTQFGPVDLFNADFIGSALGSAFVQAATLRESTLAGALALEANFREVDLEGANLEECDLREADLRRTIHASSLPHTLPPEFGSGEGMIALFEKESPQVRRDAMFSLLILLSVGPRSADAIQVLTFFAEAFALTQDDITDLMPAGELQLESVHVTPPDSQWLRRAFFSAACALAATMPPPSGTQVQVLVHFGEQWGFSITALKRIIEEHLNITLS